MPNRSEVIRASLDAAFSPSLLDVIDESEQHRGHAGFQDGGESHFRVRIASDAFSGLGRLARHRAVHAAIGKQMMSEIHALALEISEA